MSRNLVDLHTHSTASDGKLSPGEVVRAAGRKRLAAVALTDHDTTAGLAEAAAAAKGLDIRFVPGVEVSAKSPRGMLHVVGLGIAPEAPRFRAALRRINDARRERNPKMVARLQALGVDISMAELQAHAGASESVGRLHMAQLLCRKGRAGGIDQAFRRFLGPGAPAFVDKAKLDPREVTDIIHDAGGLAVVAHPVQLGCENLAQLETVVRGLRADGLDGIEVYHPDHTPDQTRWYLDLARRLEMLVSGGSDFHGLGGSPARVGVPAAPLAAVEQLLAKLGA